MNNTPSYEGAQKKPDLVAPVTVRLAGDLLNVLEQSDRQRDADAYRIMTGRSAVHCGLFHRHPRFNGFLHFHYDRVTRRTVKGNSKMIHFDFLFIFCMTAPYGLL